MKKRLAEKEFNEMLFKRAKRSKDETHESSQDAQIKVIKDVSLL